MLLKVNISGEPEQDNRLTKKTCNIRDWTKRVLVIFKNTGNGLGDLDESVKRNKWQTLEGLKYCSFTFQL